MRTLLLFLVLVLVVQSAQSFLSCKDEKNNHVDWYINYKLPKINNEPTGSLLEKGRAYAYLSPSTIKWKLSTLPVSSESSMMGLTWQAFKKRENELTYYLYNDDPPEEFKGSAVGHLKGMFAFDGKSGFWLTHSIPRFPNTDKYEYPESAFVNGQIAMCITFNTSTLNDLANHLLFCNPNVYKYQKTLEVMMMLDEKARSLLSKKPNFIRKAPFQRISNMKSTGNVAFLSIAKDNQLNVDIFSQLIASELKTSLVSETWRRGKGTFLEPHCKGDYTVVDVTSIAMNPENINKRIFFKSTEDHSKWAISLDGPQKWVCISDLNRMVSQSRRGGGAICFKSASVWKAFRSIIADTVLCPVKK